MSKRVWLITGAGRGMGADFAKAALAAGHAVVATGRNSDAVSRALGKSNDLLSVTLDVTNLADAEAAARAAVDRFGRIDVLVNNAASFYAGYFEELTPEQFERQLSVSLIGPMNVTRAVLPLMRKQRSGHIISISSSAGLAAGYDFASAYAASKFGLEGWMESLQAEVAPFGITTTIVNPGFFRTELLTDQSTTYAKPVHRRLRRAQRTPGRILEGPEWSAIWRPREARTRARCHCGPEPAAAPVHRRCRCHRHRRAEGRGLERPDRGEPRPVDIARIRLRLPGTPLIGEQSRVTQQSQQISTSIGPAGHPLMFVDVCARK
jgi:NAD(P)-dependent dehydrogenase (short-subunit alcohol dehydrogenase family)